MGKVIVKNAIKEANTKRSIIFMFPTKIRNIILNIKKKTYNILLLKNILLPKNPGIGHKFQNMK